VTKIRTCALCRTYAQAIVELLDPQGLLFGDRVIAAKSENNGSLDQAKQLMQACPSSCHTGASWVIQADRSG
jgi:ferredoxin